MRSDFLENHTIRQSTTQNVLQEIRAKKKMWNPLCFFYVVTQSKMRIWGLNKVELNNPLCFLCFGTAFLFHKTEVAE